MHPCIQPAACVDVVYHTNTKHMIQTYMYIYIYIYINTSYYVILYHIILYLCYVTINILYYYIYVTLQAWGLTLSTSLRSAIKRSLR